MEVITKGPGETKNTGKKLAASLIESKRKSFTGALIGNLGSGKTTFVQGFAQGLGIKQRIISPTFILMRRYSLNLGRFKSFYHVDLYRITEDPLDAARNLGLMDILRRKGNIVLVEWGEKIKDVLPKNSYWVEFKDLGNETRKILFKNVNKLSL